MVDHGLSRLVPTQPVVLADLVLQAERNPQPVVVSRSHGFRLSALSRQRRCTCRRQKKSLSTERALVNNEPMHGTVFVKRVQPPFLTAPLEQGASNLFFGARLR